MHALLHAVYEIMDILLYMFYNVIFVYMYKFDTFDNIYHPFFFHYPFSRHPRQLSYTGSDMDLHQTAL